MADPIGFQKLKNAVATIFSSVESVATNLKDGFQLTDLLALIPIVPGINDMVKNFPEIKAAFLSMNNEQRAELLAQFKGSFNLPNEDLEKLIEDLVDYAVDTIDHGKRGIALVNRIKELKEPASPDAPTA